MNTRKSSLEELLGRLLNEYTEEQLGRAIGEATEVHGYISLSCCYAL